ncbi:hypothetical protein CEUSTIGMA_g9840.t1 [Chlamydomonas eustigma]|uniref:Secretory carrier-associated membrane protein n=1 Tax=Chlamydomonas eustigma TaxID=1157962 RepID=A0A250XHK9_9CHLO|nr:hypothetical protein CEUSTIGMA_g9840.t1 [Chlamydomonas eustigma]|eukprot:GAX82412.1 hypothetical protein CEUSTIGMA_g9840.t1 [Chlamydomonas eustigma]
MATGGWGGAAGAWSNPKTSTPEHEDEDDSPHVQNGVAPSATTGYAGAYANPQYNGPPPAAATAFTTPSTSVDVNREALLDKREAELRAKEAELRALEQQLKDTGVVLKKKNWPICYPLVHHDIPGDIPENSRRVVREIYFCWWGLVTCMLWNFFCASTMLGTNNTNRVASWFLSIFFAVLGIPLSFWGWYLSIYDAAAQDSTFGYVKFFLCFAINCLWCIWCAVGPQLGAASWSFAGWLTAFPGFGESTFIGTVYIVGAAIWSVLSVYTLWCMKDAYLFFRGKGGVEQAKQEAALAAFRAGMQNQQQQGSQRV